MSTKPGVRAAADALMALTIYEANDFVATLAEGPVGSMSKNAEKT